MNMGIIICGGGTAGHIYPAVAIIENIRQNYPDYRLLFVGTKRGMENKFILDIGVDFTTVKSSGLNINRAWFNRIKTYLKFLFSLNLGFLKSLAIIIRFKPDIILGMGGYVCAPVLLAAIFLRKKIALHEQNYIPGRLNMFFSRFSKYFFISFNETKKLLNIDSSRVIFSGNPVREIIRKVKYEECEYAKWNLEKGRFTIIAFGGSLGAEKINNTIIDLYKYFKDSREIQILLICGVRYYDELNKMLKNITRNEDNIIFKIYPYINEMNKIYRIADLVISRAGANTVAELIISNIPAILIPYPKAVDNHQYYNAKFLADSGKAILILDKDLNKNILAQNIEGFLGDGRKEFAEIKKIKIRNCRTDSAEIITSKLVGVN